MFPASVLEHTALFSGIEAVSARGPARRVRLEVGAAHAFLGWVLGASGTFRVTVRGFGLVESRE